MNKTTSKAIGFGILSAMLLASALPALAASNAQMKACKVAVLEKPKLSDFPMAAVSVRQGNKENHVAFTVRWDGAQGHGNCKVSPDGYVKEVNLKEFHSAGNTQRDSGGHVKQDGFWRDDSGKWIDPAGEVCNSCTPENGFPAAKSRHNSASRSMDGFYYDRHTGQWRDPSGEVCHSCTPENGFPNQ